MKDLRRYAKQTTQWAIVVATIVVLFRVGRQHQADLTQIDLRLNLGWLPLAAIATITANLLLPLGWRQIIASFNHSLAPGRAVRVWCLAQTARYFPTGLLAIASRLKLATKEGISKSVTATSIAIETAILFGWAALICALFVPSTTFPTLVRWLGGTVAAVGLALTPWAVPTAGKLLARTKRFELPAPKPPLLSQATGLLGASVAIRAVGTLCLAAGFFNSTSDAIPLILGASYAAVVAGMIGVTPAGLGVREGVMAAILASHFGLVDAAAFALLSRAWEFSFEMLFLAVAAWWGRQRKSPTESGMDSHIPDGKL